MIGTLHIAEISGGEILSHPCVLSRTFTAGNSHARCYLPLNGRGAVLTSHNIVPGRVGRDRSATYIPLSLLPLARHLPLLLLTLLRAVLFISSPDWQHSARGADGESIGYNRGPLGNGGSRGRIAGRQPDGDPGQLIPTRPIVLTYSLRALPPLICHYIHMSK